MPVRLSRRGERRFARNRFPRLRDDLDVRIAHVEQWNLFENAPLASPQKRENVVPDEVVDDGRKAGEGECDAFLLAVGSVC